MHMVDFTTCSIDKIADYRGHSGQKKGILYNNERYILKYAEDVEMSYNKQFRDTLSPELRPKYSNDPYTEHMSCRILKRLGFDVQDTILGTVDVPGENGQIEKRPVIACKNFLKRDYEHLVSFHAIVNALSSEKPLSVPRLSDIYKVYCIKNDYFDEETGLKALSNYWKKFVLDAFLLNTGRRSEDWGYIASQYKVDNGWGGSETKFFMEEAPIYSFGPSMVHDTPEYYMPKILKDHHHIDQIIRHAGATLLDENDHRIEYYDFLTTTKDPLLIDAVAEIFPKIDMKVVHEVIDEIPMSETRKDFYKIMLDNSYTQIMQPAYEHSLNYHNLYSYYDLQLAEKDSEKKSSVDISNSDFESFEEDKDFDR